MTTPHGTYPFFFYRYGGHRDLHSFPTRRSSDLLATARAGASSVRWTRIVRRANATKMEDRKSTRLNSSHSQISYAVFCLKKKTRHSRPPAGLEARSAWHDDPR